MAGVADISLVKGENTISIAVSAGFEIGKFICVVTLAAGNIGPFDIITIIFSVGGMGDIAAHAAGKTIIAFIMTMALFTISSARASAMGEPCSMGMAGHAVCADCDAMVIAPASMFRINFTSIEEMIGLGMANLANAVDDGITVGKGVAAAVVEITSLLVTAIGGGDIGTDQFAVNNGKGVASCRSGQVNRLRMRTRSLYRQGVTGGVGNQVII